MANNGLVSVTIVGNLVGDPELRFTPNGNACAKFTVAVNRKSFNPDSKKWEDSGADFYRVTAWRLLAENITASECMTRGTRVIVQGALKSSTFETADGDKRTMWEITADAVGPDLMFAQADEVRRITPGENKESEGKRRPTTRRK